MPGMTVIVRARMRTRDKRALARLAKHYGRTPSFIIRRLISDETARLAAILGHAKPKETDHGSEENGSK
jgi:hypothetical protein